MKKKPPAFQFYPDDFLGSTNVALMTDAEIGVYVRLLCYEWNGPGLPTTEPSELAAMLRIKPATFAVMWKRIGPCFVERDGRLFNPRLDKEREKQAGFRALQTRKINHRWEEERKNHGSTTEVPRYQSGNTLQSPSPSNSRSSAAVAKRDGAENGNGTPLPTPAVSPTYLTQCVVALNAGLAENPRLQGMQLEVPASTQVGKVSWEEDGVPIAVAAAVVRDRARAFVPSNGSRGPRSLKYFDAAVRERWELDKQVGVTANDPDARRTATLLKRGYSIPLKP